MFLRELKDEQKGLFLDLCLSLSLSDNEFSNEEKDMVKQLCAEMMIKERYEVLSDMKPALEKLTPISTKREKRIMLIELAGIVLADGKYAEEEKALLNEIGEKFSVSSAEIDEMMNIVLELYGVYKKIGSFLNGNHK